MKKNLLLFFIILLFYNSVSAEIIFARVPFTGPREMIKIHKPLIDYLENKLNTKIEFRQYSDYKKLIDAIDSGIIDIAWMGSLSYIQIKNKNHNILPIVRPKRYNKEKFRGEIIVRKDSKINTIYDLKNKKMAFTDKNSTSGYFLQKIFLLQNLKNIKYQNFIKKEIFIPEFQNILYAVLFSKVDAGAVFENAQKIYLPKSQQDKLKTLSFTESIYYEPIIYCKKSSSDYIKKLKNIFINIKDEKILNTLKIDKFISAEHNDYKNLEIYYTKYYDKIF